jgi:hypothetical protein
VQAQYLQRLSIFSAVRYEWTMAIVLSSQIRCVSHSILESDDEA